MSTDPFNTADNFQKTANIEAWSRYPRSEGEGQGLRLGFKEGAEWGHAQALAQEPDPAGTHELDESAPIRNLGYYRSSARCKCGYEVIWGEHDGDAGLDEAWRVHLMRSDVHAVRRNEETR